MVRPARRATETVVAVDIAPLGVTTSEVVGRGGRELDDSTLVSSRRPAKSFRILPHSGGVVRVPQYVFLRLDVQD